MTESGPNLPNKTQLGNVGFEVLTMEIMKSIFWDVILHSFEVQQYSGEMYHHHL
jgi:hypothetical protein